jgi:hypothetical protein
MRGGRKITDDTYPLSYSRIARYQTCPRWYKFESVEDLGSTTGEAARLGTALHEFHQTAATDGIETAYRVMSAMVTFSKSRDFQYMRDVAAQLVTKKDALYGVEVPVNWAFDILRRNESGDELIRVEFQSYLDFLFVYPDGVVEIVDGKSGRQLSDDISDDPQGKSYGVGILKHPLLQGLNIWKVIFTQAQWRLGKLVSTSFTLADLQEHEAHIQAIAEEIVNDQKFAPSPGIHCSYCPFVFKCDAANKMLPKTFEFNGSEFPVILNDDNERDFVRGYLQLQAIYYRYSDIIRGRVKESGVPVSGPDGRTFDYHTSRSKRVSDASGLIHEAERLGVEPDDLSDAISLSKKAGKLIKDNPTLRDYTKEISYVKWGYRKPDEDDED